MVAFLSLTTKVNQIKCLINENDNLKKILIISGLFILTILTRYFFISHYLYSWDSVNYALSLDKLDLTLHQPHPPGYILYIYLGKFLNTFINNPNLSFTSLSLICSGFCSVLMYYLGSTLSNKKVGVVSTAIFIFTPLYWFYGEVPLTYIVDLAFILFFMLLLFRNLKKARTYEVYLASIILGLSGGIRQFTPILLFPVFFIFIKKVGTKRLLISLLLFTLFTLMWFSPLIKISGGINQYLYYSNLIAESTKEIITHNYLLNLKENLSLIAKFIFWGNGIFLIPLGFILLFKRISIKNILIKEKNKILIIWFMTSFGFYALYYVTHPGVSLIFMPVITLACACSLIKITDKAMRTTEKKQFGSPRERPTILITVVLMCLANSILFLFSSGEVSFSTLRLRNQAVQMRADYINSNFNPNEAVVITSVEWFYLGFRHAMYYLPKYQTIQLMHDQNLDPSMTLYLTAKDKKLFLDKNFHFPDGTKYLILFSDSPETLREIRDPRINPDDVETIFKFGSLKKIGLDNDYLYYVEKN